MDFPRICRSTHRNRDLGLQSQDRTCWDTHTYSLYLNDGASLSSPGISGWTLRGTDEERLLPKGLLFISYENQITNCSSFWIARITLKDCFFSVSDSERRDSCDDSRMKMYIRKQRREKTGQGGRIPLCQPTEMI